jgi:2-keto-4-pentenoate hydratase/2-oxohepta-3-ene-1,7-dioic acid hydratase in catechol pathway
MNLVEPTYENYMRFVTFRKNGQTRSALAVRTSTGLRALAPQEAYRVPQDLKGLIERGRFALQEAAAVIEQYGDPVNTQDIEFLPPVLSPGKIICVGLNYLDHTKESRFEQPSYPTLFLRVPSSMGGHEQSMIRPLCSNQYDFEGELAAIVGKGGRHIVKELALDHVAGYSVANEGSVRDFQFRSPQWTVGKNFDRSGSIGPDFVSAEELPQGGAGLKIETRLNGEIVQCANTSEMVFDLATVISLVSEAMTLEPGDVILTGTPAGVGFARTPPLFMSAGDVIEVEVERIGILRNRIVDEVIERLPQTGAAEATP